MSILSDDFGTTPEFEKEIEQTLWMNKFFAGTTLSVLVATPTLSVSTLISNSDIPTEHIYLVNTKVGDYGHFARRVSQMQLNHPHCGIVIDNIDKIPDNADREYWEEFVRFALKRENDYPVPEWDGHYINFGEMHIAVGCDEKPAYLEGASLQAYIIV